MEDALTERARTREVALPVALAGLIVLPFCLAPIRETDAGWHLAIGRLVATDGIPFRNALSWTFPDLPWYATSWLYDWLAFQGMQGGVLGLQLFTFALTVLTLLFVGIACRQLDRLGAWVTPGLALLLIPRITQRPHMASWAVLAAVLALGAMAWTRGWQWRAAAIPVVMLGSNLHAGAVFPSAALAFFCLEAAFREKAWRREALLAALGIGAMVANPGGLFNLRYLIDHLSVREVVPLGEFESPTLLRAPTFYGVSLLAIVAAALVWKKRPVLLPLTVVFFGLGVYALRLVYESEIVSSLALAAALPLLRTWRPRLEIGLLAIGMLLLVVARGRYWSSVEVGARFDAKTLPVHAAEFIAAEHLDGPEFTAFRDGGYLSWAVPGLKVFQDARVQAYPPSFFAQIMKAQKSPAEFQSFLRDKGVEWAIASRVKEDLAGYRLMRGPDWALVHWDEASEIYLRRDVPRFQPLIQRLEYRSYVPGLALDDTKAWSRERLQSYDAEAQRQQAFLPESVEAGVARCFAQKRLGLATAAETCGKAASLATDDATLNQLQRIARVPALTGS